MQRPLVSTFFDNTEEELNNRIKFCTEMYFNKNDG